MKNRKICTSNRGPLQIMVSKSCVATLTALSEIKCSDIGFQETATSNIHLRIK